MIVTNRQLINNYQLWYLIRCDIYDDDNNLQWKVLKNIKKKKRNCEFAIINTHDSWFIIKNNQQSIIFLDLCAIINNYDSQLTMGWMKMIIN